MGPDARSSLLARITSRTSPRQIDWLVVGAVAAVGLERIGRQATGRELEASLIMLPFATLPLLWRRGRPGRTLAVLATTLVASLFVGPAAPGNLGVLFGLYAAARYGNSAVRAISGAAAAAATATPFAMVIATGNGHVLAPLTRGVAFGAGVAWLLGEVNRTRSAYLAEIEGRVVRLAREQEEHARRAIERERIRIAGELHDVVTHNVSVIAIQASAAGATSSPSSELTTEVLGLIGRIARDTLSELRTLLGVLRVSDPQCAPRRPNPSLGDLDEIVKHTRAAGVDVSISVLGTPVRLDAAVDLAAYRLLQEALTNVVKHAGPSRAIVTLDFRKSELIVSVRNDGRRSAVKPNNGFGLIGMRERVELAGGDLQVEAIPDGFQVRARLPIGRLAVGSTEAVLANPGEAAESMLVDSPLVGP